MHKTEVTFPQPRLTTVDWLSTLRSMVAAAATSPSHVEVDLRPMRFIGQMPLLALCLGMQHLTRRYVENVRVALPADNMVRAFLERWEFKRVADAYSIPLDGEPSTHRYGEAARMTRVLPVKRFDSLEAVVDLRSFFRRADTEVRTILENATQLQEPDIRGFADLIIFELCKNAVEHPDTSADAFIFGRVSPHDDPARERHPAAWEAAFFDAIGKEGMTEVVLGDGGVGVVESVRPFVRDIHEPSPEEILDWAFQPFSTRKAQRAEHTRGLWAVKQKVRQLRGLLYIRSGYTHKDDSVRGISATWDFLNRPGDDIPLFSYDDVPFAGTQYQLILPHRGMANVNTRVAWHRVAAMKLPKLETDVFQLPPTPRPNELRRKLSALRDNYVLFIDMSLVEEEQWGHKLDELAKELLELRARSRALRVWLLNPSKYVIEQLSVSTYLTDLWRLHGLVQPYVTIKDESAVPHVDFLVRDPVQVWPEDEKSKRDEGDTEASRRLLAQTLSRTVQGVELDTDALKALNTDERQWFDLALERNNGIVAGPTPDATGRLIPAFDIEKLSAEAITLLTPRTLMGEIHRITAEQKKTPCVFQLPSRHSPTYCTEYIPPTIFRTIPAPSVAAVNEWVEWQIRESGATDAMSFSIFARDLLPAAARADRRIRRHTLQHHLPMPPEIEEVPPGSSVVLLASISGAARTLEHIASLLMERQVTVTIICIIDTVTPEEHALLPAISALHAAGRWRRMVAHPIPKYANLDLVPNAELLPISVVDPETLVPVAPVSVMRNRVSDGDFWRMVASAQALSTEPVTYKGIDYTNLIWVSVLFDQQDCIDVIHRDFETVFSTDPDTPQHPDVICVTKETWEGTRETKFWSQTKEKFPNTKVRHENDLDLDRITKDLEAKRVVIFAAASSSGGGIARLIRRFQTARFIHLSIFINRVSEAILASFVHLQQPRMTVTSFQRLYSQSPELSRGSTRSLSLRYLNEYRASCLSNRLVLFVHEKQRVFERTVAAQTPDELAILLRPISVPHPLHIFERHTTYDFSSQVNRDALARLVSQCNETHRPWLGAILEEVAAREDASRRDDMNPVMALYEASQDLGTRHVILQTLVLERWHGRSQIESPGAPEFGNAVLADLMNPHAPVEFRSACVRSLSKLNRELMLSMLADIIRVAMQDRETELTLALELSKLLDDEHATDDVLRHVGELVQARRHSATVTEFDVSLANLLNDVGLELIDNTLQFRSWPKIYDVLSAEPPDESRTIRFLVRSMRRAFGLDARILVYRVISDDRHLYMDAWPPRPEPRLVPLPHANIRAFDLLEATNSFYSPRLADDPSERVKHFLATLRETNAQDAKNVETLGIVLYKIVAADDRAVPNGDVIVVRVFLHEATAETASAYDAMKSAAQQAAKLIARNKTDLPKIGEWQYLRMIERVQSGQTGADEDSLIADFSEQLALLLGADMVTLLALNPSTGTWSRRPVPSYYTAVSEIDQTPMTTLAAKTARIVRYPDAQAAGKDDVRPPVDWVHGCVALPLTHQARDCRYVVNLWHHVRGWFDEDKYSEALLNNLKALGGFFVEMITRYQEERLARGTLAKTLIKERSAEEIANMLLICELWTRNAAESSDRTQESLSRVQIALEDLRSALGAVLSIDLPAGPQEQQVHLEQLVEEAVADMKKRYRDVEFRFDYPEGLPTVTVDVPVIRRAIDELLKNARTHVQPASKIRIAITKDETPSPSLTLEVTNQGFGIDPQRKAAIFEGPGVGLHIAKLAAERHGGRIQEVGMYLKKASFRLTLPIRPAGGAPPS